MPVTIDTSGAFIERPPIGALYLGPEGDTHEVASSWDRGVVFTGGPIVKAHELLTRYKPRCSVCLAFHEPEYPHKRTRAFRAHIQRQLGRKDTKADTYAHCSGVMREAVIAALPNEGAEHEQCVALEKPQEERSMSGAHADRAHA